MNLIRHNGPAQMILIADNNGDCDGVSNNLIDSKEANFTSHFPANGFQLLNRYMEVLRQLPHDPRPA